jgi:hypothetical protein
LIWGRTTKSGREQVIKEKGFTYVLSLEIMIRDLLVSENKRYFDFIKEKTKWCNYLFDILQIKEGR